MTRAHRFTATLIGTLLAAGLAAGPASAKDGGGDGGRDGREVKARGVCTVDGVKSKLKARSREHGTALRIEVEIDDVGRDPQVWTIVVTDSDETKTVTGTTRGRSNEIERKVTTANGAGPDTVTFTATRTGASCTGSVVVP